jgi:CRISPR-associated exonuclease Cas4
MVFEDFPLVYTDEELVPISALQHLIFCARQCAFIHIERVWRENSLTAEGQILHRKTNNGRVETYGGRRIARSVDLVSRRLGLVGKSDVVEFHPPDGVTPAAARKAMRTLELPERFTRWTIVPIEYKRGKPKTSRIWGDCDRVQLCAQALCLEEMLGITLERGELFYGEKRRRVEVELDTKLRERTEQCTAELHDLLSSTQLPNPVNDRRCQRCSLNEICMPEQTSTKSKASRWIAHQMELHHGIES